MQCEHFYFCNYLSFMNKPVLSLYSSFYLSQTHMQKIQLFKTLLNLLPSCFRVLSSLHHQYIVSFNFSVSKSKQMICLTFHAVRIFTAGHVGQSDTDMLMYWQGMTNNYNIKLSTLSPSTSHKSYKYIIASKVGRLSLFNDHIVSSTDCY